MFANLLSGMFSFRFLLPVIALLSAGGYGYFLHTNKSNLKNELEIANARIASFDAEIGKHKDELDDRNDLIRELEKEIIKRDKVHEVTQNTINNLSSKNAELSQRYNSAVTRLGQIEKQYEGRDECFNEVIPIDVIDVINNRVRIETDTSG